MNRIKRQVKSLVLWQSPKRRSGKLDKSLHLNSLNRKMLKEPEEKD
jgi:hypothetical protein